MVDLTMKIRKLDGVYFRVERNGEWMSLCFSDLTPEEREEVLKDKDIEFVRNLANILADTLADIGEQLDLTRD